MKVEGSIPNPAQTNKIFSLPSTCGYIQRASSQEKNQNCIYIKLEIRQDRQHLTLSALRNLCQTVDKEPLFD